jgi:hypothetical protein
LFVRPSTSAFVKRLFAGILCLPVGHDWSKQTIARLRLDNKTAPG